MHTLVSFLVSRADANNLPR